MRRLKVQLTSWALWIQNCRGVSLPWQGQTDIPRALLANTNACLGTFGCCLKFTVRLTMRGSPLQAAPRNCNDIKRASLLSGKLVSQRGFWSWKSLSLGFPWDLRGFRCARTPKRGCVCVFSCREQTRCAWGHSCAQVQVWRGYGNGWRKGTLHAEPLVQPEKKAQKKLLGAHETSVRLVLLPTYHRIGRNTWKNWNFPNVCGYF